MKTFGLSLTLIAAAAVTACGQQKPQEWNASAPTRLCTDNAGRRVPDANCDRRQGGGGLAFFPYFIGRGAIIPPYGGYTVGGSRTPSGGVAYGRAALFTSTAPAARGFGIRRGGFGASAHGGAGE